MRFFALLFVILALASGAARAQAPSIGLELNRTEDTGQSCRIYLVVNNATDSTFQSFLVDLVLFDGDDVIQRRIAFDSGPLPARRMRVKLFDLERLSCAQIARIHYNDVIDCRDETGKRDCAALVRPSSRTRIKLTQ